jgi:hypothetical protein
VKWERRLRSWLRGANRRDAQEIFRAQTAAFARARSLVRCYYIGLFCFTLVLLPDWPGVLERKAPVTLWPVAWLGWMDLRMGIALVLILYLAGALAGVALPGKRWARALAFLGLFEYVALNNSFGKIGHSLHVWVLTAGVLIFLPDDANRGEKTSRTTRQKFLTVFWACQALLLLVYAMAGLGKLAGAVYQLAIGQNNAFMPGALAAIVAERLVETNSRSLLGPWLVGHPLCGWPLMLGDIYLQLFSFCVVFRPTVQRAWAFGLIVFHIGSYLLLTINFAQNALLLALFFFNTPFLAQPAGWRRTLADLPLVGAVLRRLFPTLCAS